MHVLPDHFLPLRWPSFLPLPRAPSFWFQRTIKLFPPRVVGSVSALRTVSEGPFFSRRFFQQRHRHVLPLAMRFFVNLPGELAFALLLEKCAFFQVTLPTCLCCNLPRRRVIGLFSDDGWGNIFFLPLKLVPFSGSFLRVSEPPPRKLSLESCFPPEFPDPFLLIFSPWGVSVVDYVPHPEHPLPCAPAQPALGAEFFFLLAGYRTFPS